MDAIINGKIIIGNTLQTEKVLLFDDKIRDIIPQSDLDQYAVDQLHDAKENFISPGFIDIHVHGTMGHDVMDGDWEGIKAMGESLAAHGVTGFLATTMTMDRNSIKKALLVIKKAAAESVGSKVVGCHLEGPFISPKNAGAQNPSYIQNPDFELVESFKELIKVITIAPELEGAQDFIQKCVDNSIVVSIGHSRGTYEDAIRAIDSGARSVTHTFNAMTALNHREPGIVGAALDRGEAYCELIADNIHVHPAVQRILLRIKGIDRVILVTDSMRASGMGSGAYDLGGQAVFVEKESARLANGTLAGSILTLDRALRNFKRNTGVSVMDAVKTVTENPARLLKMENTIGSIAIGKHADLVIHDEEFSVQRTLVNGKLQYAAGNI